MRWVVTVIAVLAVLGCIAASAFMNWLFMTSLGKTDIEREVFGIVSLAVSGFLSVLPVLIMWAWQARRMLAFCIGLLIFIVCASVSLSSAVGFAASNRGETTGGRETVTAKFISAQEALGEAEKTIKELPAARPGGVVTEAIEGVKQNKLWLASKECADSMGPQAREFCKGYFTLKAELAAAGEAKALKEKIEKLRGEINVLRDKGAGREADAQAAVIGRVLGIGTGRAQEGLALLLAIVVELMAGFGFYLATSHVTHGSGVPKPKRSEEHEQGRAIIDVTPARTALPAPRLGAAGRRVSGVTAEPAGPRRINLKKGG
jgi:hypothetical protein